MAEDKYKIGDRDDEVVCPYDKSHTFRCSRLPYHLMKCRHQYRGLEYQLCRYNARHEVPQPEIRYHEANCLDRAIMEPLITYEQQKNDPESRYYKGCTDIPSYKQSDENLPPPTENWDREISTMIRIGVDPNYLYNDRKINNTMGLVPSKKKQLNQYFLKKLNAENGQTSIQNIIDSKQQETDETQLNVSETGDCVRLPRTSAALFEQIEQQDFCSTAIDHSRCWTSSWTRNNYSRYGLLNGLRGSANAAGM